MAMPSKTPTYWDYIKVEEILALQTGLGDDEVAAEILEHLDQIPSRVA